MIDTQFDTAAQARVSRRGFLKAGAALGGGLMLAVCLPGTRGEALAAAAPATNPNAWVHIGEDNTITVLSARSEMGQGVYTAMPMLIAEELGVDMDQIHVEAAPVGAVYTNALLGAQITGGSTSVRDGWLKLRVAGAQMREMLVAAAAKSWGVPASSVRAERAMLIGPNGHKATFGSMAAAAATMPVPPQPRLKDPKDFRIVGTRVPRVDTPSKVNGSAVYGIDVTLPGMVYATLRQCPVIGGTLKHADVTQARGMPGVIDVVQLPDAVAVVADSWWRAKKALETVKAEWNEGPVARLSDVSLVETTRKAASTDPVLDIVAPRGDLAGALKGSARVVEAEYVTPLQSHSPIEPMNFTAHVQGDKALVIGSTQFQQGAAGAVAKALGIKPEDVEVRTTYLGGGFGRRLELDFIAQAALVSRAVGKPVKLLWTREEDMTHDFYRPVGVNQLKAGLDAHGKPQALHFKVCSQSITQRAFGLPPGKIDPFMIEAAVPAYAIPNARFDLVIHDTGFRVGYWRSVSHNMNAFANESFIDELAHAAGVDPVAYRMSLLEHAPRHAAVLKLAAEKAGWGSALPAGHARGVALMQGYDTRMAQVAEISRNADGSIRVHRVTVAVDLGHVVNPDIVEAQIQSAIVFGLGAALKQRITMEHGRVQQTNFNVYDPLRMYEMPQVDITIVPSSEKPGGIGEPATALVGPAVANAVFALTGKRLRTLPITADALAKA